MVKNDMYRHMQRGIPVKQEQGSCEERIMLWERIEKITGLM